MVYSPVLKTLLAILSIGLVVLAFVSMLVYFHTGSVYAIAYKQDLNCFHDKCTAVIAITLSNKEHIQYYIRGIELVLVYTKGNVTDIRLGLLPGTNSTCYAPPGFNVVIDNCEGIYCLCNNTIPLNPMTTEKFYVYIPFNTTNYLRSAVARIYLQGPVQNKTVNTNGVTFT